MGAFIAKPWDVTVAGYGTGRFIAAGTGRALADAWRSDAFGHLSFGEFLKIARIARAHIDPAAPFGDPITIEGRPAFFIDRNRACINFVYPDSDVVLSAHPYDVLPEKYRPEAYRATNGVQTDDR